LILIGIVFGATKECGSCHETKYYQAHKNQIPTAFYYPDTISIETDRCKIISNQELRKQYPWIKKSDQVEHIADTTNGTEYLVNCNKNIRGNLIISIGEWNMAVGNMCWKDVENEKRLVYGDDIVNFSIDSVRDCCENNVNTSITAILIFSILVLFIFFTLFGYTFRPFQSKSTNISIEEQQFDTDSTEENELDNSTSVIDIVEEVKIQQYLKIH
jgi:hypothetical protein